MSVVSKTELNLLESTLRALYETFICTDESMDSEALQNFARDCNLIEPKLRPNDVDLIFVGVKLGKKSTLSFDRFQEACRKMAMKKEVTYAELVHQAAAHIASRPSEMGSSRGSTPQNLIAGKPLLRSYLRKKGMKSIVWKERFVVLEPNKMEWYKRKGHTPGVPKGILPIPSITAINDDFDHNPDLQEHCFEVESVKKTFIWRASGRAEKRQWLDNLLALSVPKILTDRSAEAMLANKRGSLAMSDFEHFKPKVGFLQKRGRHDGKFSRRYCVVERTRFVHFFDDKTSHPCGAIMLRHCTVVTADDKEGKDGASGGNWFGGGDDSDPGFEFALHTPTKKYNLKCDTQQETDKWVEALQQHIDSLQRAESAARRRFESVGDILTHGSMDRGNSGKSSSSGGKQLDRYGDKARASMTMLKHKKSSTGSAHDQLDELLRVDGAGGGVGGGAGAGGAAERSPMKTRGSKAVTFSSMLPSFAHDHTSRDETQAKQRMQRQSMSAAPEMERQSVSLKIFATTFNMGEASMPKDLSGWIKPGFDMYAIGVQECLNVSKAKESIRKLLQRQQQEAADGHAGGKGHWKFTSKRSAKDKSRQFVCYSHEIGSSATMLGYHGYIALIVFVQARFVQHQGTTGPHKKQVTKTGVKRGADMLVAKAANKGAVCITVPISLACVGGMEEADTSITFITAHLAADKHGKSGLNKRNADAQAILSEVGLGPMERVESIDGMDPVERMHGEHLDAARRHLQQGKISGEEFERIQQLHTSKSQIDVINRQAKQARALGSKTSRSTVPEEDEDEDEVVAELWSAGQGSQPTARGAGNMRSHPSLHTSTRISTALLQHTSSFREQTTHMLSGAAQYVGMGTELQSQEYQAREQQHAEQKHAENQAVMGHVVLMGDFNYRVDMEPVEVLKVVSKIYAEAKMKDGKGGAEESAEAEGALVPVAVEESKHWSSLMEHDQLRHAMEAGTVFNGFSEAPICFPPTFRRIVGLPPSLIKRWDDLEVLKQCYTLEVKEKAMVKGDKTDHEVDGEVFSSSTGSHTGPQHVTSARTPSYTDRVLWRSPDNMLGELFCEAYAAAPDTPVNCSDHAPVHAALRLQVPGRHEVSSWERMSGNVPISSLSYFSVESLLKLPFFSALVHTSATAAAQASAEFAAADPIQQAQAGAEAPSQHQMVQVNYSLLALIGRFFEIKQLPAGVVMYTESAVLKRQREWAVMHATQREETRRHREVEEQRRLAASLLAGGSKDAEEAQAQVLHDRIKGMGGTGKMTAAGVGWSALSGNVPLGAWGRDAGDLKANETRTEASLAGGVVAIGAGSASAHGRDRTATVVAGEGAVGGIAGAGLDAAWGDGIDIVGVEDPGDRQLYLIVNGEVEIIHGGHILDTLGTHNWFGEDALSTAVAEARLEDAEEEDGESKGKSKEEEEDEEKSEGEKASEAAVKGNAPPVVPPRPDAVEAVGIVHVEDAKSSSARQVQPRFATVRTRSPTTLLCLSASAYRDMRSAVPSIGASMDRLLQARVSHGKSCT
jgi:CRP-like cAMP-binding protein